MTRAEVVNKVTAYVQRVFGATDQAAFQKAFNAADENTDGRLSTDEMCDVLEKAGVSGPLGGGLVRWAVAKQALTLLDRDGDGYIEWSEFVAEFAPQAPAK